ncbi:adenylate/guanylate cyclase domain-containing protein [Cupriavidus metallidurans]|mgnify:CR=1 FL=1|jgi:adenylate cyclase|uniref:Adenylate/guanylate cyclase domain-containing protein n=1 Tax=Cupriavidus metallidurans TaxID=119219 RepID=A0A2L0X3Q0_9BURK|nr:adenylate/guanylate cyclase domain-containing protein [Cupriavidus metallidurans]QBP12270.1 adenylate/guanylate cyclase domain-containing protein [Cupriavidus metallidurans]QWC92235.1 adenylate/guanylate cyclase domain-containing protein [Cupriavidus metallidurans]
MSGYPSFRRLWPTSVRSVRLATGLVLFTYIGTHLLNHSLGNFSLTWLERDLLVQKYIWQGWVGTILLYGSLVTHFFLGLWALYERRALYWTPGEMAQLLLGLCIPPLLANHVVNTRIAIAEFGMDKGYAQVLYAFWIDSPFFARVQLALLVVAWLHGCYGVWFWLRLKPWFGAWRSVLTSAAVLLPVLALLGFLQGGREVAALAQDPVWRAAAIRPATIGTPPQNLWLAGLRTDFLLFDGGALLLVLAARLTRTVRERRGGRFAILYPNGRKVLAPHGFSVLEASRLAGIPHASTCGGRARCTLCRVRVLSDVPLPAPAGAEQRVLDRLGADPQTLRLACQLRPTHDLAVWPLVPPAASAAFLQRSQQDVMPQERFAAFMFVDMRDSTRLAAAQLPFDSIFVVSRFMGAVCSAVVQAGGQPNQFLGDAVLAIFGLNSDPSTACRQALRAVPLVAARIDELNAVLQQQLQIRIRFGIGLHCGRAVVGQIGFSEHVTFTAIGDPLNVASRLEQLTKEMACEAIVSDQVFHHAGVSASSLPHVAARLRGRDEPVPVRILSLAAQMPMPPA